MGRLIGIMVIVIGVYGALCWHKRENDNPAEK